MIETLPFLTARFPQVIYAVFALLGIALGPCQIGFGAAELAIPVWLVVSQAVFAFLGASLGLTAANNVPREPVTDGVVSAPYEETSEADLVEA